MSKRILVVEDDRDIARLLDLHLRDEGYSVSLAADGDHGLREALSRPYDLVILDLILPGLDGLELCRRLRSSKPDYTPVLMLTAKSSDVDRILGLEIGADDYLAKPFNVRELLARVKALFRRLEAMRETGAAPERALRAGDLVIEPGKRKVTVLGKAVHLTAREFELLLEFASHPGKVYTRALLLDKIWGYNYEGYEHTVNSHINRLREKIERNPASPRYILTVRGAGYRFAESGELRKG